MLLLHKLLSWVHFFQLHLSLLALEHWQLCVLFQVSPAYSLPCCTMSPVLRIMPPVPSTIPQHILHVFPSLIYPAVHDASPRLAIGEIVGSSENQGSRENRNCIQGSPLCDSFLILSRLPSSWRVMALLGNAVGCANNLDVLESERLSLEMTHFRVLVSAITKSLSKLILMKWSFVKDYFNKNYREGKSIWDIFPATWNTSWPT